jgi:chloramphenicol O-acetyltransferase type A
LRKDGTFGFAYFSYHPEFKTFIEEAKETIKLEKMAVGLKLKPNTNNLIHYSVLPGIEFSSMQHAQMISAGDSVPKIVFGKIIFKDGQVLLPISVHVNHAVCDGLHVSKFLEEYGRRMRIT